MATRDVQFVIRARDEASRAFDGIAQAIEELVAAQQQLQSGSGQVTTDLGRLMEALTGVDKVARTISQGTQQAGSAFENQAAKVAELRKQLNALEEQRIASVRAQGSVNAAGAATGNAGEAAAQTKAIEAAQAALEKQINRVTGQLRNELGALTELGAQQNNIQALATAFKEIAPNATAMREGLAAAQALAGFAKEIGQSVEQEAAARERAAQALRDQAAAAAQEVQARNAQSGINQLLGVRQPTAGTAAASAAAIKAAMDEADAEAKVTTELEKQAAAAKAQIEINKQLGVTGPTKGAAAASAAVFEEQLAAAEQIASFAQHIEESHQRDVQWVTAIQQRLNPLPGLQAQYAAQVERANAALKAGLLTEEEHVQVLRMLETEQKRNLAVSGIGADGRPTLFGMTPWQMTNLSYQVNDVVSGFAMGQKPSQIIAQQLGQIIQLFPRLGSGIMAAFSNPYFLGAAGIFAAITFAIKQAADQEERLRAFAAILKANADGAFYNAKALEQNVEDLKNFALTTDEATAIVKTFVKEGVNPTYFDAFGGAAKNLSRVLGTDVKTAATQVSQAFTGGYTAVTKLDDATNFLTAAERDHIRSLFESGNAAAARSEAFDKFNQKYGKAANDMRGPWTQAVESLDKAWNHFRDALADSSWVSGLENLVGNLANIFDHLATAMDHAKSSKDKLASGSGTSSSSGGTSQSASDIALQVAQNVEFALLGTSFLSDYGNNKGGASTQPASKPGTPQAGKPLPKNPQDPKGTNTADEKAANDSRELIRLQQELADATSATDKIRLSGEVAYKEAILQGKSAIEAQIQSEKARADIVRQLTKAQNSSVLSAAESYIGRDAARSGDKAVLESLFQSAGIKAPGGGQLDPQKVAWCAAFVNAVLYGKGVPGTGSLAAGSFKNFGTATANPEQGDIVVIKNKGGGNHVGFFEGFSASGGVRVLGGNQDFSKGKSDVSVETFARSSVESFRRAPIVDASKGLEAQIQKQQQLDAAQNQFNEKLDAENASRALAAKYATEEVGATVDKTYELEKQKAIDEAVKQKQDQAKQQNLPGLTREQLQALKDSVATTYDQEHAEQLVNDRLKEQGDLRQQLLSGIAEAMRHGDNATADALKQQLESLTPAYSDAIQKAEDFWNKQADGPKKTEALQNLRELRDGIKDVDYQLLKLKDDQAELRVGGAQSLRDALQQHINNSQLLGDSAESQASIKALKDTNDQLKELIQNAIDAKMAMLTLSDDQLAAAGTTRDAVEAQVLALKDAQNQAALMGRQYLATGQQINQTFAQMATSAFDSFFQKVGQGEGVFQAFKESFVQMAIDFLKYIAEMIIEQLIFNAISGGVPGGGGGMGGGISSFLGGLFGKHHNGGIAGSPSMFGAVSPAVFAGAMRYHTGGLAGLAPDEVPAILKKGEEVLTQTDARHRNNMGRGGGPGTGTRGLRQILALGDDEIAKAMAEAAGEEVVLTHIKRNRATVRSIIGDDLA